MPVPRKLVPEQERQVALAYLCGVDTEYISQEWKVSDATIRTNIVGKRALEWNDPLVEFYRQTEPRNRERNSAHLYLAYTKQHDVPHSELVSHPREEPVFRAVTNDIYEPRTKKVIQRTGLDVYVKNDSGLERLLSVVVGMRSTFDIVEPYLQEELHQQYQQGTPFSLDNVFRKVFNYIVPKIKAGGLAMTPQKAGLVYEALQTLTEREREMLSLRYGLSDNKAKTPEEIGQQWEITRERVRQIEAKALRKLRHPTRQRPLKFAYSLATDAEVESYRAEIKRKQEQESWRKELYPGIEAEIFQRAARDPSLLQRIEDLKLQYKTKYDGKPVEELELSVRAQNCLAQLNIKTVGELLQRSEMELLRTKNAGRKTLKEIKDVLVDLGLRLPER